MGGNDIYIPILSDRDWETWFKVWDKTTMEDLIIREYDPEVTDLRGAFREAVTELIHETEL